MTDEHSQEVIAIRSERLARADAAARSIDAQEDELPA